MSWRETLGVAESGGESPAHNTHNTHNSQKPVETGNCADIADSAYRDSEPESSKAMSWRETLGVAESGGESPAHNTHNTHNSQKPVETGNCADIADSASPDAGEAASKLLEALSELRRPAAHTTRPKEVAMSLARKAALRPSAGIAVAAWSLM